MPLEGNNHILRADEAAWPAFKKELNEFLRADEEADDGAAKEFATLTAREREVLDCIARGQTNSQIAECLRIGEKTVRNHVTSVFSKLGVSSRAAMVARLLEDGSIVDLGRDAHV